MFAGKPWRWPLLVAVILIPLYLQQALVTQELEEQDAEDEAPAISHVIASDVPDFASFTDVSEKKQAFFSYFYPLVESENKRVLAERKKIKRSVDGSDLADLCTKYRVDCAEFTPETKQLLLKRADVISPSLALAQAANESAWGTSRFAVEANNFFGQWCFTEGCGVVPARRSEGSYHEVRRFASAQKAVRAYILNINTTGAYKELRAMRQSLRAQKEAFTGSTLAEGLMHYSERGQEYIDEVRAMIRTNRLEAYDEEFWQTVR